MRRLLLLVSIATVAILSNPARAQFCPGISPWVFDDVQASDPFCGFITWMADNGITLGCQVIDANHRLYCPNDSVTRKQMAAFMNRLGDVRVEAVDTGPGLTGGPITSVGTINLATTQLLPTTACATNQVPKWNGSAWACSADANGGGTVTSVGSGTGLTGGPITTSGTLSLAGGYQLPQSCTNGQVPKSNGAGGWTCASDATGTGTVTSITAGAGLTGGTITSSGTIAVDPASTTLTNNFFRQGGNAFGTTAVMGTTDNNAIDVRANGARVMRYEPNANSPNILGGHPNNTLGAFEGQTVGGGGAATSTCYEPATATFTRSCANHTAGAYTTVAGGSSNAASALWAVVAGGGVNTASGIGANVLGGGANTASGIYASVLGGQFNTATGDSSSALGNRARSEHNGAFAYADFSNFDFLTQATNEFAVRATGGARFVTKIDGSGNPTRTVKINANGELDFGSQERQMLNLWGPATYGIGVQAFTLYSRSDGAFAWFADGVHSNTTYDPGAGGSVLATLQVGASATAVTGTFRAQVFTATSDRAAKADFAATDAADVLEKVVSLPIATWSYHNERDSGVRHIGPTAQDFKARFGVGYDDKTIATVDADGVALAAIQGLNAKLEARIAEQAAEIAELRRAVAMLLARAEVRPASP